MKIYKIHKYLFLIIMILTLLIGCNKNTDQLDFDFSFQFNVNGEDIVSTFDNTFRVHTIQGFKKISLTLSDSDKVKVKEYIINSNLVNEVHKVKEVKGDKRVYINPSATYILKYRYNEVENEIRWNTSYILSNIDFKDKNSDSVSIGVFKDGPVDKEKADIASKLVELEKLIKDIVYSYEEVIELPEHIGYQ